MKIKKDQKKSKADEGVEAINLSYLHNYSLSLIEAIQDPVFVISPKNIIIDVNNSTVIKTEVSYDHLIGTSFSTYFTAPKSANKYCDEVFKSGSISDRPLVMKDGQLREILLSGAVYKDTFSKVIGAVLVARDITEQNRTEKELLEAKLYAELSTVIAEEAKCKAELAAEVAVGAVKSKQRFLSNMSHEIRTPMNAIIGFTKVLLKSELTERQREFLNAIKLSGDALIVLINDILDLAKAEAGKMTFEQVPFKMYTSIATMMQLFEQKTQEKNTLLIEKYDHNIPENLIGDSTRLNQILINLLSNAAKFTSNGEILFSVQLIDEDQEKVTIEFSISDTGIGISDELIHKIFENFQQANDNTTRLYGGTGLGLAIVKQLVEAQGGNISVQSKIGEGSIFKFSLAFLKSKIKDVVLPDSFELDKEIKNISVLIVEDMALNQLLMKTLLDDFGFENDFAANGEIAIEKLLEKKYDIILMDLQMPIMNGFQATEHIRNTMLSNIPIIALTADVTTVDLTKCISVGMNDYIAKPIDEKLLYNKIIGLMKTTKLYALNELKKKSELGIERYTNLDYLSHRTKSNPLLMMEMISLYLAQTPVLIKAMKQSLKYEDWTSLNAAVHKIIPSFSIMGISVNVTNLAIKIMEYTNPLQHLETLPSLVAQLEHICKQSCIELEEDLNALKIANA